MLDNETSSWLKEQLRAGGSYTILSAIWLGRLTPEEQAKWEAKKRKDKRIVDMILAGYPVPREDR